MLQVRRVQLRWLEEWMVEHFEDRLAARLRRALPDATAHLTEPELRAAMRGSARDAARYGIRTEWDVMRYVQWVLLLGRDFDARPEMRWAADILGDAQLDGAEKMDAIEARWLEVQLLRRSID